MLLPAPERSHLLHVGWSCEHTALPQTQPGAGRSDEEGRGQCPQDCPTGVAAIGSGYSQSAVSELAATGSVLVVVIEYTLPMSVSAVLVAYTG